MSIYPIDCHYHLPGFAGAFLIKEGNECALVETNTANNLPHILLALEAHGLTPDQVRYVIVTHAHLDHAGGAGTLLKICENAKLVAHPRAAKHLIDPEKLKASAISVYGEARFRDLYGELVPCPKERVITQEDHSTLEFGSRTLTFLHTRGHANHHFCILDSETNTVFTGDTFGLAYPALQEHGLFIFPSSSPTDFLPDEAISSVNRIEALKPKGAWLTHFGFLTAVSEAAEQLREDLRFSREILMKGKDSELVSTDLEDYCYGQLERHVLERLDRIRIPLANALSIIGFDLKINAQGIAYQAMKLRNPKES